MLYPQITGNKVKGVRVSRGKKYLFFGKFSGLCSLATPVLRFTLSPHYRQNNHHSMLPLSCCILYPNSILTFTIMSKKIIFKTSNKFKKSLSEQCNTKLDFLIPISQNNKTNMSEKYPRPEIDAKWENTFRKKYKAPQPNTYNRNRLKLTKVKIDKRFCFYS